MRDLIDDFRDDLRKSTNSTINDSMKQNVVKALYSKIEMLKELISMFNLDSKDTLFIRAQEYCSIYALNSEVFESKIRFYLDKISMLYPSFKQDKLHSTNLNIKEESYTHQSLSSSQGFESIFDLQLNEVENIELFTNPYSENYIHSPYKLSALTAISEMHLKHDMEEFYGLSEVGITNKNHDLIDNENDLHFNIRSNHDLIHTYLPQFDTESDEIMQMSIGN